MSQIGFRDIQTQDKMTAVKPGMSENKPVNRITIAHNQETKLHHNLDTCKRLICFFFITLKVLIFN